MSSSPSIRRTSSIHNSNSTTTKPTSQGIGNILNNANFPPPSATTATLGHLPRKPAASPNPRNSPVVGILNTSSGHPASPSSGGFGKGGQGFGRIGVGNNNDSPTNPSTTPIQPYLLEKRKKSSNNLPNSPVNNINGIINTNTNQTTTTTIGRGTPTSSTSPHPTRRLGSFNSLAVSINSINNSSSKDLLNKQNEEKINNKNQIDHPLRFEWVFWVLHRSPTKKMSEEEFGRAMRRLGSCNTVETFYPLYLHIKRPSTQTPIADIHIFSKSIKPVWEDPSNVKGGKWTIRLKKGLSDRLWESLILSLIGGGLEKLINSENHQQEICGAVLSIRRDEDILSVWHKNGDPDLSGDGKIAKKVKLSIQTVLQLPLNCNLVYKLNADSLANGVQNAQKIAQQNLEKNQKQQQTRISRSNLIKKRELVTCSNVGNNNNGENFGLN
ncbi:hypothetical protein CROQUDRAFT_86395 [Cronartium quercuum f. sp. fusiforme G11]|uniref:Uncharacterized protein n=1 Tax=Cronartium quercuum f. sp. fusiforme G11 TaxID=708437 RepID=A0A9P6TGG6_9BASI|nr:hypothetical protein CROQUDRAFT_86395 [Cronartium quercuum f. sp. fusiforme G11]